MFSKATRALINAASFIGLCWIVLTIYQSFTNAGLWRIVREALSGDYSRPSPAGVFAICMLAGFLPIAALSWAIWRLFLRGRPAEDFPAATLKR